MNIETGVFAAITSGHYVITFSGFVDVHPGQVTEMWLHHNGVRVEESEFQTSMHVGGSGDYMWNQGSRTVVSITVNWLILVLNFSITVNWLILPKKSSQIFSLRFSNCSLVTRWILERRTIVFQSIG